MLNSLLAEFKEGRAPMVGVALGALSVGAAFVPISLFAYGPGIDCWSFHDWCCECKAGKVKGGELLRGGAAGLTDDGDGEGYSCKKNQSSGYHLCENDGTEGFCGRSGPVCGLD